ncbi:LysR family transcriptional regulator [Bacillus glycinifermentans]|uniref:LysR family transcriptional regulator n=1 Tax=Bacillus glycinifermentans TaxID=1664069 RepID=UPI002DBC1918|nr:LysR family transcriptional regulator [Bacillus glycinifermentans]MEC3605811.1 LysR family transcriptional regulator [Bacillus glycinifermentans]
MELHQIDNFIAVSKHRHFTKAAMEQCISQPALSRSVKKLEEELGVPLFIRGSKSVRLTKYGKQFLVNAKKARHALDEGVRQVIKSADPDYGEISVSFLHTLGSRLMPQLIAGFKKRHPHVEFRLYQGANEVLQHMVETGEADICLSSPPLPNDLLEWTILDKEPLYLVLPADHPLAGQNEIEMKAIAGEDFVGFKQGYGLRYVFDQMCRDLEISPKLAFEGEEVSTILGLVSAGLGAAILPKTAEHVHLPVVFCRVADYRSERKIGLAVLKDHYLSPAAFNFKQFVIEYYQRNARP